MRKFLNWLASPFVNAKIRAYIKRLRFALEQIEEHPEEGPMEPDRTYIKEVIIWLIRYYREDSDATAEGTPEIKLTKFLRTPPNEFHRRELIQAKTLSHWNQYKHIEGY
jgi:hypothetical protein